jgi:hypothetical protein
VSSRRSTPSKNPRISTSAAPVPTARDVGTLLTRSTARSPGRNGGTATASGGNPGVRSVQRSPVVVQRPTFATASS